MAGIIAFIGVLFVARPTFLFPVQDKVDKDVSRSILMLVVDQPSGLVPVNPVSPAERMIAVLCAIVGSLGAATAYATIRVIGTRAHALVSVNYFAVLATVGSVVIIIAHPDLQFELPRGVAQW